MALKELSILEISGDENQYQLIDTTARENAGTALSTAQSAQSTAEGAQTAAESAQSIANTKLKSASLKTSYADETKTLTLSILTATN